MKQRSDGRWVRKVTIDGKQKFFYSHEKSERSAARDIDKQLMSYDVEQKNKSLSKHNFITLAEAMIEAKIGTVSNATIECYKLSLKHMSAFFDMDIEDITPVMLQSYLDTMAKKGYAKSTIQKSKIVYGLTVQYAIMSGLSVTDFTRILRIPQSAQKNKITAPDDKVISVIKNNALSAPFGDFAFILLCTGMRRGEISALQISDIDFKSNTIHVTKAVEFISNQPYIKNTPKTANGVRDIPITDALEPIIKTLCIGREQSEFLFGGKSPLTLTMIKKRWKKYCTTLNIDIHMHQLRHAYAKILYRAGVDAKTAQGLLGHADITTTMNIYTDFAGDVKDKAISSFNSFFDTAF